MENWRNELYHYGIYNQKWGVRRFQNPDGSLTPEGRERYGVGDPNKGVKDIESSRGIQKRLNDVDKATAFNKREHDKATNKYLKFGAKARKREDKLINRGKSLDDEKLKKLMAKTSKNIEKAKSTEELIKKGEAETWKLIAKAIDQGYSVNSKEAIRLAEKGWEVLPTILPVITGGGAIPSAIATTYTLSDGRIQSGHKYKVSADGQGKLNMKESKAAQFIEKNDALKKANQQLLERERYELEKRKRK